MTKYLFLSSVLFLLFCSDCFSEQPDSTLRKIIERRLLIDDASQKLNINPDFLCAIIYTERELNYDWSDETLDILLAKTGQNSSIGFCQIKLKTAYWIEVQLSDSACLYYPGREFSNYLPISKSPKELLEKLTVDSINILYAAAFLRIIQSRWSKAGFSIDNRPDVIGTLYSTGLFYPDGTERLPRRDPEANEFGRLVKDALHIFQE